MVIVALANKSPVCVATLPRIDDVVVFATALTEMPSDIAIATAAEIRFIELVISLTSRTGKIGYDYRAMSLNKATDVKQRLYTDRRRRDGNGDELTKSVIIVTFLLQSGSA